MIFAISDIHAHYDAMKMRIDQIRPYLNNEANQLIMIGDFIDRGPASYECLQLAFNLQQEYGSDKVIVLRGNHEEWFLDFIYDVGDEWLAEDDNYRTSGTFLFDEQKKTLSNLYGREEILTYIKDCINLLEMHLSFRLDLFYELQTSMTFEETYVDILTFVSPIIIEPESETYYRVIELVNYIQWYIKSFGRMYVDAEGNIAYSLRFKCTFLESNPEIVIDEYQTCIDYYSDLFSIIHDVAKRKIDVDDGMKLIDEMWGKEKFNE